MWWYYTSAIAAACVAGLVWLALASRGPGAKSLLGILIALPLLIGAIILGIASLIAYVESGTGVHDALAHLPTFVVLLHRALHVVFGAALAAVCWLLWQAFD